MRELEEDQNILWQEINNYARPIGGIDGFWKHTIGGLRKLRYKEESALRLVVDEKIPYYSLMRRINYHYSITKNTSMKLRNQLPRVSFIIPTLNAALVLSRCLMAIRNQNYPQSKVEIIISDGGSSDNTVKIARKYNVKVINNPDVLHEHGKSKAAKIARGDILFYTDADNVLAHRNWLNLMVRPYMDNPKVMGFLPQTLPAPDSNAIDRYLGYLFTDPLTWFIYYPAANPMDYDKVYTPIVKTKTYKVYKFPKNNFPLFGLSQGVGTHKDFQRDSNARTDDLLAGIKLIEYGGLVAYVPEAGVYHYHVTGFSNFIRKYSWRIINNFTQEIKGMGLVNRVKFFTPRKKLRMYLFLPYAFSIVLPLIDAIRLSVKYRDLIMFWHIPMSFVMATVITKEAGTSALGIHTKLTNYS